MRTLNDLTPDERSAYRVWQSKLKDRTLSAEQHDQCRREVDNLLWKGPNAQVLALKADIASISARLERLEFHAGLGDDALPTIPDATGLKDKVEYTITDVKGLPDDVTSSPDDVTSSPGGLKDKVEYTITDTSLKVKPPSERSERSERTAEETRGRKKLRFTTEKDVNRQWRIVDREALDGAGDYTDHGPYKTKKAAGEMVKTLNNMPTAPPLPNQTDYYHDGDGVIREAKPPIDTAEGQIGTVISRVTDDPAETITPDDDPLADVL